MLKFLLILVVAIVAAKAYEYTNVEFNNYLFDEFQSSKDDDAALDRQRRDADVMSADGEKKECGGRRGGEGKKDFMCCTGDKFDMEHFKKIKETKKQCAMKLRANNSDVENFDAFDCEKMARIKQLIICEGECFAKTMNILDDAGAMNREVIMEHFKEHVANANDWKKSAYEGYVDKCLAKVKAIERPANQQCNSAPMEFHHCIWSEFVNGCPADLRIDTPKCNKMRERHSQGQTGAFLNKHILHDFLHGNDHRGHGRDRSEEKDV